uniref:Uncharacterized protein n=1 Tax=Arundo donax TaxID=35708 RepID=A0A0A9I116_ARUDO
MPLAHNRWQRQHPDKRADKFGLRTYSFRPSTIQLLISSGENITLLGEINSGDTENFFSVINPCTAALLPFHCNFASIQT